MTISDFISENDKPFDRVDTAKLSPREQEILGYLRQGYTEKQIAVKLSIAQRTVNSHCMGIRRALRIRGSKLKNLIASGLL